MDKFKKNFLLFVFLTFSINIGIADNNINDFHGIPSYTILAYPDRAVIDQGEKVSISLYIAGGGDVDANKIRVSIPPYIVDGGVELKEYTYNKEQKLPNSPPTSQTLDTLFGKSLPEEYFQIVNYSMPLSSFGEPQIYDDGKKYAPITITFTVNHDAPAGDHEIFTYLFYKNGSQWYLSEKSIGIHIRHWYEKSWFYEVSLIVSILFVLELVFRSKILNRLYNWVK